jgi:hypothetical protein
VTALQLKLLLLLARLTARHLFLFGSAGDKPELWKAIQEVDDEQKAIEAARPIATRRRFPRNGGHDDTGGT